MKSFAFLILIFLLASCEEITEWPANETITPRLVVEGFLTNNPDLNYVRLSLPVSSPNHDPVPVKGAAVVLISANASVLLTESTEEAGYYSPESPVSGVVGEGYRLYISLGQYEFISEAVWMLPVYETKDLRYYEIETEPGYYLINPVESNEASFIKYHVKYENPELANDTIQKLFYSYTLRTVDVNQFFKPDSETLIFPVGAMVIRTKYSLAPDHERYIRSLLSETEWKGGWFDLSPGNLQSNMSEGAVGYFGACSVLRDTVYLQ